MPKSKLSEFYFHFIHDHSKPNQKKLFLYIGEVDFSNIVVNVWKILYSKMLLFVLSSTFQTTIDSLTFVDMSGAAVIRSVCRCESSFFGRITTEEFLRSKWHRNTVRQQYRRILSSSSAFLRPNLFSSQTYCRHLFPNTLPQLKQRTGINIRFFFCVSQNKKICLFEKKNSVRNVR